MKLSKQQVFFQPACDKRVESVKSRDREWYVYEPVQEPSGQVLAKIKAWLDKPINGQARVQVQVVRNSQL